MDELFPLIVVVLLCVVAGFAACSSFPVPAEALSALHSAGYSDAEITDESMMTFRCSDSDVVVYDFKATNPAGNQTTGAVCCGIFKGCTIRH